LIHAHSGTTGRSFSGGSGVDLKLASGTTAPHRLRDLADVQEIVKARGLDESFAAQLDESVRPAYLELCRSARSSAG